MSFVIIFLEIVIVLLVLLLLVRSINHDNRITGLEKIIKRYLKPEVSASAESDEADFKDILEDMVDVAANTYEPEETFDEPGT